MQRAVVLLDGDTIDSGDLLFGSASREGSQNISGAAVSVWTISQSSPLANHALRDIGRVAILSTLESTGGNKTEAARRLGVTARTLSNKMKLWRQMGLVA